MIMWCSMNQTYRNRFIFHTWFIIRQIRIYYLILQEYIALQFNLYQITIIILDYAAKVVVLYDDDENRTNIKNEFRILQQLEHESIIKAIEMFEVWHNNQIVMIFELVQGQTLDQYIQDKNRGQEGPKIVSQLLQTFQYLHSQEIVHRDIQNANIMVDNDGNIKLIDFGVAKKMEYQQQDQNNTQHSSVNLSSVIFTPTGVTEMRPPEIQKFYGYTLKSDVWQLGLVFFELFTCKKVSTQGVLKKIKSIIENQYCSYDVAVSQIVDRYELHLKVKQVLIACLQKNPEKRSSVEQLQTIFQQE